MLQDVLKMLSYRQWGFTPGRNPPARIAVTLEGIYKVFR